jgi:hypothetical protein
MYKTKIYLLFCETSSRTLREEYSSRVLENGSWGEYLDQRGRKLQEAREDCKMGSLINCTLHQILLGWSNQGGRGGKDM